MEENLRKDIVAGSQLAIKEGKFTFNDRVIEIEKIFNLKSEKINKIDLSKYEFLFNYGNSTPTKIPIYNIRSRTRKFRRKLKKAIKVFKEN